MIARMYLRAEGFTQQQAERALRASFVTYSREGWQPYGDMHFTLTEEGQWRVSLPLRRPADPLPCHHGKNINDCTICTPF